MGPSMIGSGSRRAAPRSNFASAMPFGGASDKLGSGLTKTAAPSLKREKEANVLKGGAQEEDEAEVYSDPDEGVQIVDMDDVRKMDWMAPETLLRGSEDKKRKSKKKAAKIKKEEAAMAAAALEKGVFLALLPNRLNNTPIGTNDMTTDEPPVEEEVNLANAVDLSESEEEEELEDIIDDFSTGTEQNAVG